MVNEDAALLNRPVTSKSPPHFSTGVYRLGEEFFRRLPERPGVYLMQDASGVVLYVGKAKSLRQRLGHYRVANPDRMGRPQLRLLRQVVRIELEECADEPAALAREAELLRTLKPRFNRAGVWPSTPRFLAWRRRQPEHALDLAITDTPTDGWRVFGPFGSGVVHLRAALVRLLWSAQNPAAGSTAMPEGWVRGRLGSVVTIAESQNGNLSSVGMDAVLARLFGGDADRFVAWIGERTQALVHAYDREIRDADLETLLGFMQAKARRTLPFNAPDRSAGEEMEKQVSMLPFPEEAGGLL